jgi:hypothetical protein
LNGKSLVEPPRKELSRLAVLLNERLNPVPEFRVPQLERY